MNTTNKKKGILPKMLGAVVIVLIVAIAVIGITNFFVIKSTEAKIKTEQEIQSYSADAILVLGAAVLPSGQPSEMLRHRLEVGISLYHAGVAPKIIMSGDNGTVSYNEVRSMKEYAIDQGVPSEDIFCDHAGFSTYESMYRAKSVFQVEKLCVVTQSYHLYRALYSANNLGMKAYGVSSDLSIYGRQNYYDVREIFARTKDFFQTAFKTEPTFLGEPIDLNQSGDISD